MFGMEYVLFSRGLVIQFNPCKNVGRSSGCCAFRPIPTNASTSWLWVRVEGERIRYDWRKGT